MDNANSRLRSAYLMGRAARLNQQQKPLEARIREAQGEPKGEAWDFDITRIQAGLDDGSIWHFEGSVGRAADDALNSGACFLPSCWTDGVERPMNDQTMREHADKLKRPIRDYWGSMVPYREMLRPGTKGTLEHSAKFYGI